VTGRIGHLVRARLPRRPRANGWLPVPGWTGAHEWQGWIPHEEMPRVMDPLEGLIVTANNRVAADDGPDYLCTDCHPPYRARRVLARLREDAGARSVEGAAGVHADTLSPNALLLRERLAALPEPAEPRAAALRARLLDWDGRMEADSAAPTAYVALRRALTAILAERSGLGALAGHALLSVPPGVAPLNQLWWTLPALLREDDTGPPRRLDLAAGLGGGAGARGAGGHGSSLGRGASPAPDPPALAALPGLGASCSTRRRCRSGATPTRCWRTASWRPPALPRPTARWHATPSTSVPGRTAAGRCSTAPPAIPAARTTPTSTLPGRRRRWCRCCRIGPDRAGCAGAADAFALTEGPATASLTAT
jgi:hypothetical protein